MPITPKRSPVPVTGFSSTIFKLKSIAGLFWMKFDMKVWLLAIGLLLIAIFSVGFIYWRGITGAPGTNSQKVRLVITRGMSAGEVGYKLQQAGLIKNALAFKILVILTGRASDIRAGEYSLSASLPLLALVSEIGKGPTQVWVTIPEGLRHEEIAIRLGNGLGLTGTEYTDFVNSFIKKARVSEGYLFPDTYLVPKDLTASKAVDVMLGVFSSQTKDLSKTGNFAKALIVASLVEREAKTDAERPVVAGIIYKRLDAGWPLQIDASVQYAVATAKCSKNVFSCKFWDGLTKADLGINSAYNVYKYKALPPTPICNPGLASIKAAVNPETSDFWFYLHDAKGGIHYAKTVEEHNANIRQYLGK